MQLLQEIKIENNKELGAVVSSRVVANELNRTHKNVIRDLENILIGSNVSSLIIASNYKDSRGRNQKEYLLTKRWFHSIHVQHSRSQRIQNGVHQQI